MKPSRFTLRPWLWYVLLLIGVVGVMFMYRMQSSVTPPLYSERYLDTTVPAEERIANLLAQMTLAEKIGQMALVEKNSLANLQDIATYGLGGVLSGAGAKPPENTLVGWQTIITEYQRQAATSRLAIPLLYGVDAVHGFALIPGATVFPHQIGLGATGDAELVEKIAQATAQDLVATGINWNYAPNLDLPTDIRWGRMYEAYSDDPILTARLSAAYVKGLQTTVDDTASTLPVLATLKHFVGVGAMQWGTSINKNYKIDQGVTPDDMTVLRETYLPPYQAAIDAGALSIMVGLNVWGDDRLIINKDILTGELKNGLGFKGFVVSDWYGLYEGTNNKFIATVRGINAGVDMVMLPFDYQVFTRHMIWAHRFGLISEDRINDAVTRILRAKFALGLFDGQAALPSAIGDHSELARTAVAQSLVLLKNDTNVLPLSKNINSIKVAGSAADNVGLQSGAWTIEWQGVDGNWLLNSMSILDGIKTKLAAGTRLEYSVTGDFATGSARSKIGIAVVGETPYAEGWGDRAHPILSNADLQAIKNLEVTCDEVVVIIVSGRPLLIANEVAAWNTLVAAWLPGTQGGGVADVLFGERNFMGSLPVPWPRTSEQLPITTQGATADGTAVLFPRYFGLSYWWYGYSEGTKINCVGRHRHCGRSGGNDGRY